MNVSPLSPLDRLMSRVVKRESGCWEWTGAIWQMYGRWRDGNGKCARPHRSAYEMLRGPIPDGLVLDHLCRNTICVNPDHLEAVTQKENNHRGFSIPSLNRFKTHCPRGHEYTEANVIRRNGRRFCRECKNMFDRGWRAKSGAAQKKFAEGVSEIGHTATLVHATDTVRS